MIEMSTPIFDRRKVRPLRERMGLSQEEFARRLGVHRTLVVHWEQEQDDRQQRTPTGPAALLLSQLAEEHHRPRRLA
jgi:DNA-binding transcriptional regulator YiaG